MTPKPKRPVPRALRVVNVAAGLLFLTGAAVYLGAWIGLDRLRGYRPEPDAAPFSGMARFDQLSELSRIGLWIILASLVLAVIAAIAAVIVGARRRSADSPSTD